MREKVVAGFTVSIAVAVLLSISLGTPSADAGDPSAKSVTPYRPPRGYVCYRAREPIKIDGILDEPSWRAVPWTEDFVDIQGNAKPKPRYRTRAKMLWDSDYLYIAAELEEPHVWATVTRHDAVIFQDNDFEIFIDPNGDSHEYYEVEINALGTEWDLLLPRPYKDGGKAINSWEIPGLKKAVHVEGTLNDPTDTDNGWTVEIAFPWKVLGELAHGPAPPQDGDQWRVNFSRVEWQHAVAGGKYHKVPGVKEDNWVWSPQGVIDMHRPETWGYVQFSTARPGSAQFNPDPTGPARHLLHVVYYAQRVFREKNHRWAKTTAELGLGDLSDPSLAGPIRIETTRDLYQASVDVRLANGTARGLHIRQDALIWAD
jgi:hypothetical protein